MSATGAALVDAWLETADLRSLPAAARAWACHYLLDDLAHRHGPDKLARARSALVSVERELTVGHGD